MIRRCVDCEVSEDTDSGACWCCEKPWTDSSPLDTVIRPTGAAVTATRDSLTAAGYTIGG